MSKIKVLACDAKGCEVQGREVKSFGVTYPDGVLNVDLCPTHAAPLRELRASLPAAAFTKVRPGSRGRASTQFRKRSMDEIEKELADGDT